MKPMTSGGGWKAIGYTLRTARDVGWLRLWRAMRSRNACKTCALGMGGQRGGMVNEAGHFPEVCKKSLQAMAADMQDGISSEFFARYSLAAAANAVPARARILRPAGHADPCRTRRHSLPPGHLGRGLGPPRGDAAVHAARTQRSSTPAAVRRTRPGFLLQLFARAFGTNNVNNCSYYCHQASGVGLGASVGTGTATVQLEDVEHSDLFILIGGNPGLEPSAPDAQPDEPAPPRRPRHRHQPGQGSRAGQLPRPQRRAQPAVRHRDRQPVRAAAHRRRHRAADRASPRLVLERGGM